MKERAGLVAGSLAGGGKGGRTSIRRGRSSPPFPAAELRLRLRDGVLRNVAGFCRLTLRRAALPAGTGLLLVMHLGAQELTRSGEIQQQRALKADNLAPDEPNKVENAMRAFKEGKYLERYGAGWHGFRLKLGNMVTGSGFAVGPEYRRDDLLDGALRFRASAQLSTRLYQKYQTSLTLPKIAGGRLNAEFRSANRNYRSLQYYGTGASRPKDLRTNYRLEDTAFEGMLSARTVSRLIIGGFAGYLFTNVGPGADSRFASAETVFPNDPGMRQQTNFLRDGVFAQWDYRDNPLGPKHGGNYVMQYTWYRDNRFDAYGFRRLDIDLQQYIGFLNRSRVIALRAKTTLTDTDGTQQVPFYLQPMLGGSDDLRGFRNFRFSDRNSLVFNAEYRWEIFSGLDGAIFGDAGKVFARRGELNFRDLESSVGFGLRFNARNSTFLRFDVGFSHEGFQVWVKFNDAFQSRRFGVGNGQPVY